MSESSNNTINTSQGAPRNKISGHHVRFTCACRSCDEHVPRFRVRHEPGEEVITFDSNALRCFASFDIFDIPTFLLKCVEQALSYLFHLWVRQVYLADVFYLEEHATRVMHKVTH